MFCDKSEVRLLKIITGEFIISKVDITKDTVYLNRPVAMIPVPGRGMGFHNWVFGVDFEKTIIPLGREHVMFMLEPENELADLYIKQYHISIEIPTQQEVAAVSSGISDIEIWAEL